MMDSTTYEQCSRVQSLACDYRGCGVEGVAKNGTDLLEPGEANDILLLLVEYETSHWGVDGREDPSGEGSRL